MGGWLPFLDHETCLYSRSSLYSGYKYFAQSSIERHEWFPLPLLDSYHLAKYGCGPDWLPEIRNIASKFNQMPPDLRIWQLLSNFSYKTDFSWGNFRKIFFLRLLSFSISIRWKWSLFFILFTNYILFETLIAKLGLFENIIKILEIVESCYNIKYVWNYYISY